MKIIGTWWNDHNIELAEINGRIYALHGWNGEAYTECWECIGEHNLDASDETFYIQPVYRFQAEGIDLDALEEGSAAYEAAFEIVDYEVQQ